MDKAEKINEVLELYHRLGVFMARYAFEYWKNLDVPLAQLKSLFIIFIKGSINTNNLAQELGVTPGNVTGIVNRLVEQGLIIRTQDPDDRRINIISLSEKGRDTVGNIHESGTRQMAAILTHMDLEGLVCLGRAMEVLIVAVEEHQKDKSELDP